MAANTTPIFLRTPKIGFAQTSTSAVTGTDGTDANVKLVFTADATNGSKIEDVFMQISATNVATILRFWVNNGSTVATATNNTLIHEETFGANTISQTAASIPVVWRANLALPPGYKLYVAAGTATTAINVTACGGDY